MRYSFLLAVLVFFTSPVFAQPSAAKVQADLKKDFGANCLSVSVLGNGSTSTDYVNGGYSTFYRVPVNIKIKTELPGVTKLAKGAAKYGYSGGNSYMYNSYSPGTTEYIGLPAPDTAQIRALILSMADYGMTQSSLIDVLSFKFFANPPPVWHSLNSVSITAEAIELYGLSSTQLVTYRTPYAIRVYRENATSPWTSVAWTNNYSTLDTRRKEQIAEEKISAYKMSKLTNLTQKAAIKEAEKQATLRPKVEIPAVKNIMDVMKWYHGLLMEGDYAKLEAITLQLFHPDKFDKTTKLLDVNAAIILANIKKAIANDFSTYNLQNCTNPPIESKSDTQIAWWNKNKSKATTITIKNEDNRWYIDNVQVSIWDFYSEAMAKECMAAACK